MVKKKRSIVTFSCLFLLMTSMSAHAEQYAIIDADNGVNLRGEATEDSQIVATLTNQDLVTVQEELENGWCLISTEENSGYVKKVRLSTDLDSREIALVNVDLLNIHMEPDNDSEVLSSTTKGVQYVVRDRQNGWIKVKVDDTTFGYVDAEYCDVFCDEIEQYKTVETGSPDSPTTEYVEYTEPEYKEAETVSYDYEVVYAETEAVYVEAQEVYETEAVYEEAQEVYETEAVYEEAQEVYETEAVIEEAQEVYETETVYVETEAENYETEAVTRDATTTDTSKGQDIVNYALQFQGNPYVWGGTSLTEGADCSGFTQSVFGDNGISIPRVAADQATQGTVVAVEDALPGDIFVYDQTGAGIDHCSINMGNGQIIHASTEETGIIISSYNTGTEPSYAVRYW